MMEIAVSVDTPSGTPLVVGTGQPLLLIGGPCALESEELAKTVGRDFNSEDDLVTAMSEIRSRGAEWVVVSQGAADLLALGPDGL